MNAIPEGEVITLERSSWRIGKPLSGADIGGYGQVFEASALVNDGVPMVAKFIEQSPGAQREILLGNSLSDSAAAGVVPIVDSGEVGNNWVLVMPRAETSLSALMNEQGPFDIDAAVEILGQIAQALEAIETSIVHRDLKPANILRLNGNWKLADFGIARYADAATASITYKWRGTPAYFAPEQWRGDHATSAADVYAFGVIAYQLIIGQLPFDGPDSADYRHQHLHVVAPEAPHGPLRLRLLIEQCLSKAPEARPTPQQLVSQLARLKTANHNLPAGASKLQQANLATIRKAAAQHTEASAAKTESERRAALYRDAQRLFRHIERALVEAIEEHGPAVDIRSKQRLSHGARGTMRFEATLSSGSLGLTRCSPADWDGPFEVIASAALVVRRSSAQQVVYARSHSLWFCDAQVKGQFRWYEVAFMNSPFHQSTSQDRSPVTSSNPDNAEDAFVRAVGGRQLAWPLEELDVADLEGFTDRWLDWFADAAEGRLNRPGTLPEKEIVKNWRDRS